MKVIKGSAGNVFNITEAEKRKNTVIANFSTYEGKDKDGNHKYSSWRAYFVGDAYEKAKILKEKDRIALISANLECNYDKEKEKQYITLTVFDFEWA